MKKQCLVISMIILSVLLTACNPQTIGSDEYYVQVQNNEEKYTEENYTRYEYTLNGFDEDGKSKDMTFTANHELKKNAYLRIYYKKDEVITYEEVKKDDMPEKALQLLKKMSILKVAEILSC